MPNPATMVKGNESAPQQSADAVVVRNPFIRAAQETTKGAFHNRATLITAAATQVGPVDVPSQGFLRSIDIVVTCEGGSGGSAAGRADAPWNALQDVSLQDVNGRPLVGPFNGYDLMLVNKWGGIGHAQEADPADWPSFTAMSATTGGFAFRLRIPVEITPRDGFGSLPNLTSAATYKFYYSIAASGTIYSTPPVTTLPSVRVRLYANVWSQPPPQDPSGRANEQVPPGLGTTAFWSKQQVTVSPGEQHIQFSRMGNHIRNWILVYYDDTAVAARISTEFPDEWRIEWDNKILTSTTQLLERDRAVERFRQPLDTGVFVMDYTHDADGIPGNENRHLWLPTVSGTRIELVGTFTGTGGVLNILTNEVAVRGKVNLSSGNAA